MKPGRWPEILGAVGFDQGVKPAVFIALPKGGEEDYPNPNNSDTDNETETEDEESPQVPPATPALCPASATIGAVTSGITACGCQTIEVTRSQSWTVDVLASIVLPEVTPGVLWALTDDGEVGTAEQTVYDDLDCVTPSGPPDGFFLSMSVTCDDEADPENNLTVEIAVGSTTIFFGTGTWDVPINNTIICATSPFTGGAITVAYPS